IENGERNDKDGAVYVINGGDIGAHYAEWFSADVDDKETQDQPTYTVFHMGDDRIWFRTFAWSKVEEKIAEIDYMIIPQEDAVVTAVLDRVAAAEGGALIEAIADAGALSYGV